MPRANKLIKVGDSAPLFELRSSNGQEIRLAELRASKVVLLVFLRGTW